MKDKYLKYVKENRELAEKMKGVAAYMKETGGSTEFADDQYVYYMAHANQWQAKADKLP